MALPVLSACRWYLKGDEWVVYFCPGDLFLPLLIGIRYLLMF